MSQRGTYKAIRLGPDLRPTGGQVLAEADDAEALMHLWEPGRVIIAWSMPEREPRRLSAASLASVRRKRLRRKLDRKHPLLADQLEAEELARRPAFYAGQRTNDPTS